MAMYLFPFETSEAVSKTFPCVCRLLFCSSSSHSRTDNKRGEFINTIFHRIISFHSTCVHVPKAECCKVFSTSSEINFESSFDDICACA